MRPMASTIGAGSRVVSNWSRYTPANVARPRRSSSSRSSRISRRCRSSSWRRPEPRVPYCSSHASMSSRSCAWRASSGSCASSISARRFATRSATVEPVPSSRDGTSSQATRRATKRSSPARSNARSTLPPADVAMSCARSCSTPAAARCSTIAAFGHGREIDANATRRHRDVLGRDLLRQEHEDRTRRRLLDGLQQGRGGLRLGGVEAIDDDHLAPAFDRRARPLGDDDVRFGASQRASLGRHDDQVGMLLVRRQPSVARRVTANVAASQQVAGENRGGGALSCAARTDEQVGVHGRGGSRLRAMRLPEADR